MRRALWLMLLLLVFGGTALADEPGWAFADEMFYHKLVYCDGEFNRETVSAEGRYPCSVCAVDAKAYDNALCAVERGGTVVVRITDEYMNRDAETKTVFGYFVEELSGFDAYRYMCDTYNGEELLTMATQFLSSDVLEGQDRTIGLHAGYSDERGDYVGFVMIYRHIDGCQYWCLHPTGNNKLKGKDIAWSTTVSDIKVGAGKYRYSCEEVIYDDAELVINKGKGGEELYYGTREGLSVRIMKEMDTFICIVREYRADKSLLEEVKLHIEGSYAPILLNGYMDDDEAVYVCVLSEGEFQRISGGADVVLQR